MSDMQHINLEEYSPDGYVFLCSLSVCLYSRHIMVFICSLSHVSKSVSVIYYVCHYSLDCMAYVPVLYSGCFYIFLFPVCLCSLLRLSLFPSASVLYFSVLYTVDYVWLCSLQRLSRFSIASVIVLYHVCLCALDLFCFFFLGASWKL